MAEATVRISTTTKKRLIRTAAAAALVSAAFLGMPATAGAAEQANAWQIVGPKHTSDSLQSAMAAAEADLPSLTNECRRQGGTPGSGPNDSMIAATSQAPFTAYAILTCKQLRP